MGDLDAAAASRVHYTDPRVRQLAEARWRLSTGGTRMDWLALGKDNPEALIREAKEWMRAAVAAGILPPPEPNPTFALYDELRDAGKLVHDRPQTKDAHTEVAP